jgi:hypothetical protein
MPSNTRGQRKASKRFFFEKKEAKNFYESMPGGVSPARTISKSFFASFFLKKEALSSLTPR